MVFPYRQCVGVVHNKDGEPVLPRYHVYADDRPDFDLGRIASDGPSFDLRGEPFDDQGRL